MALDPSLRQAVSPTLFLCIRIIYHCTRRHVASYLLRVMFYISSGSVSPVDTFSFFFSFLKKNIFRFQVFEIPDFPCGIEDFVLLIDLSFDPSFEPFFFFTVLDEK